MLTIYDADGIAVQTSKNLRGIVERVRKVRGVHRATEVGDALFFLFADGSRCIVPFASKRVMRDWARVFIKRRPGRIADIYGLVLS